ncbi:MAG: hypothetical protein ACETVZ_07210, partial [Phycisphaerae bacterium]
NFILAALNAPEYLQTRGKLTADLKITGCLRKLNGLQATGAVKLDDWIILARDRVVTDSLSMMVKVQGRHLGFEDLKADFCRGHIKGSFYADLKPNEPVEFGGQILAQKVALEELTAALRKTKKVTKGIITLDYSFDNTGKDLKNMRGVGQIFLDDTDISAFPVIPHMFRAIGLPNYNPLQMSDAAAIFTMSGPTVQIVRARLANRFGALEAEPEGTINMQTGHIDIYVVAVPLESVQAVLKRLPVVNLFMNLRDKLTRLHIKGHWTDPPGKIVTKEPLKDIKEGTINFLKEAANNSGQFGQAILQRFRDVFKSILNKNK